jgi:Raf kinase inhibitor-like YbhB/YbcL family protein
MNIHIESEQFKNGQTMPQWTSCSTYGGSNTSPSLKWTHIHNVVSYALLCYDPDPPDGKVRIHWIIKYIPPGVNNLPIMKTINKKHVILDNGQHIVQGFNSRKKYGWAGPCPPANFPKLKHHYYFTIYALDTIIKDEINAKSLYEYINRHTISKGQLTGTFTRPD